MYMKRINWEHPESQVTLRRPSPTPRVCTDEGRSHCDFMTKFSWLDWLPIFLTNGASLERFARCQWTHEVLRDSQIAPRLSLVASQTDKIKIARQHEGCGVNLRKERFRIWRNCDAASVGNKTRKFGITQDIMFATYQKVKTSRTFPQLFTDL